MTTGVKRVPTSSGIERVPTSAAPEPMPSRDLTGSSMERTRAVVDEVLTRAASDGEQAVGVARIALGGIILVLWPLATWDELVAGEFSSLAVMGVALGALAFSWWMRLRLRRGPVTSALRMLSIGVDALLVVGLLSSFVADPPPTYLGIGRISGVGAAYFVVLAAGIRLSQRGAVVAAVFMTAGFVGLLVVDQQLNTRQDTIANAVTVVAFIATAGVFAWLIGARTRKLVLEGAHQTLQAERTRARLGAYLDEEIAAAQLAHDELRLGGARREIAVLFSDIRDFTSRSERADPEQLVRELNEYLEVMVAAVKREGGVVDKYIGDSIMAVFGAVVSRPDDAIRAVRAARGMEAALVKLNESREKRGLPALRHGIGVHKGVAVAGNIGTVSRAQYTVIGDTVNVAARLESSTKQENVSVLVSDAVAAAVSAAGDSARDVQLRKLGDIKLKGRDEVVSVHTLA